MPFTQDVEFKPIGSRDCTIESITNGPRPLHPTTDNDSQYEDIDGYCGSHTRTITSEPAAGVANYKHKSEIEHLQLACGNIAAGWLNGTQKRLESAQPRPREIPNLTFLTHISTILTIGNKAHPTADNVVAVYGHIEVDAVHCLIFTENCGPEKGNANAKSIGPGTFDQQILHPDVMEGKKLLEHDSKV